MLKTINQKIFFIAQNICNLCYHHTTKNLEKLKKFQYLVTGMITGVNVNKDHKKVIDPRNAYK